MLLLHFLCFCNFGCLCYYFNLLSGNDVETEDGKQGMFVNIIIDYYKANCTSEKDIVITKSEDYTTPVVTGPTEKFIVLQILNHLLLKSLLYNLMLMGFE